MFLKLHVKPDTRVPYFKVVAHLISTHFYPINYVKVLVQINFIFESMNKFKEKLRCLNVAILNKTSNN